MDSKDSKSQLESIEKIETILLDEDEELDDDVISFCFNVLPNYLQNEDKAVRQRSLGVLEFIGSRKLTIPEDVTSLCNSIILCFTDSRKNIRTQAYRTMNSLNNLIPCSPFISAIENYNQSFSQETRNDLILFFKENIENLTEKDWEKSIPLIAQVLEDKSENSKIVTQLFVENDLFKKALQKILFNLPQSQQKLLKQYSELNDDEQTSQRTSKNQEDNSEGVKINVNSSAFARKGRNEQMTPEDGFNLVRSASFFPSFINILSDDIRNCFDDDISKLLLSNSYLDRLTAINILKNAFKDQKIFQNTIDIILRWSGAQFLKRQVSVAQAALNLLNENLVKGIKVSKVELYFIVPIILWSVATKSAAYGDVLDGLKQCSKPTDYAVVLLKCLEFGHSTIISNVFEELRRVEDLSAIEPQLKELARNRLSIISEPAKTLLLSLAPKTIESDGQLDTTDPITTLQLLIQKIRTIPELIKNPQDIFNFLYIQFQEEKPSDDRHVRYLLYCTHAFLSEPILISAVDQQNLPAFFSAVLNFSKTMDQKYIEALNAIGFILVTVVPVYSLYQSLIEYCEEHSDELTRFCFAYQVFLTANSLFCLDRVGDDLPLVRSLAKEALSNRSNAPNRDPLLYCLKSLLTEVVTLEQQRRMNLEFFKTNEQVDAAITGKMAANELTTINDLPLTDKLIFVKIVDKLGSPATLREGIEELIAFDSENNLNNSAINAVCKLAPNLKNELSNYM